MGDRDLRGWTVLPFFIFTPAHLDSEGNVALQIERNGDGGALDPGVVLHLFQGLGLSAKAVESLLYKKSGLLGISGVSNDMRALLASPTPEAAHAVALFVSRIGRELGSLAAALGGIDALVFTAGIGEHGALVRARVCEDAAWLGVRLDPAANLGHDAWIGFDLAKALEKRLGKPTRVVNDADMQGLAAVKGKGVELVITLGTGFGTALYLDGKLDRTVDVYPDENSAKGDEAVWHAFGLKNAPHTIRLVVRGEPYPGSKGSDISINDLIVFR